MKKITIIYELLKREGISIALLKYELKKRGYKVKLRSKFYDALIRKSDLLIVPNCYNTTDYLGYLYRFPVKNNRIINLQCEQVMSYDFERCNAWLADGLAKYAKIICWGQDRYQKLLDYGVSADNLFLTGAIHSDTLKPKLLPIWQTKKQIADKYGIDDNKPWTLFISSFAFATSESTVVKFTKSADGEDKIEPLCVYSERTQKKIIEWLEQSLQDVNHIVIYRPHPTEENNEIILQLAKKYPQNFYIINSLDIKQWILVSDKVSMWNSTSIIECYYANKNCIVLQPDTPPDGLRYHLFDSCQKIVSYEQFKESVMRLKTDTNFPISKENLEQYYLLTDDYVYSKICDVIDQQIDCDDMCKERYVGHRERCRYLFKNHIYVKMILKRIYIVLHKIFHFSIRSKKVRDKYFVSSWDNASKEKKEFKQIEKKIIKSLNRVENNKNTHE